MPQFLSQRYNDTVATIMAVFGLLLYVFVNLTSILYLGSLAVSSISGLPLCIAWSVLLCLPYSLPLLGMKVIGYTDIIQVIVLILGGLVVTYLTLGKVSEQFEPMVSSIAWPPCARRPMIILHDFCGRTQVLLWITRFRYSAGGMWINNLNYWGCNQYIVQRALGADLPTAQWYFVGSVFKLLIPLIRWYRASRCTYLHQQGAYTRRWRMAGVVKPDQAYHPTSWILLPTDLKRGFFAALTAAIVASLGKCNSSDYIQSWYL